MYKGIFAIFLVFLLFGIVVNSQVVLAQETLQDPGITPDSALWGLDRAFAY